jgi:hypothetical protein
VKETALDLLNRAHADQRALIEELTDAERNTIGTLDHWSFKDIVSHVTAWTRRAAERIDALRRGEEPPNFDDLDRINAVTFEAQRDRIWADVIADAARIHDDLMQRVEELSDDDLTQPDRFPYQRGRPLVRLITGDGFAHPELHYAQFLFEHGKIARANQLQVDATTLLESLEAWRNVARYNLACYYALTGQAPQALIELHRSFAVNPNLIEWSKQDTDLDSLRDDPEFQALYQS